MPGLSAQMVLQDNHMSRKKKSRSLKNKLQIKTGSKRSFIASEDLGKIPSKNKLSKHKKRQKSAYQKYLEQQKLKDTSAGNPSAHQTDKRITEKNTASSDHKQQPLKKDFEQLNDDELWQQWDD